MIEEAIEMRFGMGVLDGLPGMVCMEDVLTVNSDPYG